MPKRVVDGEALWLSDKVKKMPVEFRPFFANWIPLAEANGAFEANIDRIRSRVYSFLFPDASPKIVHDTLSALVGAQLVLLYEGNGKTWGYFVGIEKSGRLPELRHLDRYKGLPPNPPEIITGEDWDKSQQLLGQLL